MSLCSHDHATTLRIIQPSPSLPPSDAAIATIASHLRLVVLAAKPVDTTQGAKATVRATLTQGALTTPTWDLNLSHACPNLKTFFWAKFELCARATVWPCSAPSPVLHFSRFSRTRFV